jgi:hypothetical protein
MTMATGEVFITGFGGSAAGQGSDQGSMFNIGGFLLTTSGFHPGHAGHGPHLGAGRGRFDGRDRPGGWALHHHPGFGGRGGRGTRGSEGNTSTFGDRGSKDRMMANTGSSRSD